ncbi:hypothetical protein GCM10022252_76020 [Streptosporangium oxazolinicum]|uniref:Uncharacterized protein n=1 Tax=Streptosporangium oxazolinicum TaxID=909287 RepID=A0ABP8BKY9_9ACTN
MSAALGRTDGSRVFLAGRVLEAIAGKLIARGQAALNATGEHDVPVLPVGDRQSGYLGRHRMGRVLMADGKVTVSLEADHPAAVAWALGRDHYRAHVITYQALAPSLVEQLKAHAKTTGEPVDKNGEIVPGLTIRTGQPTPTKELDAEFMEQLLADEQIDALVEALLSGRATLPGLPAPILEGSSS